MTFLGQTYSMRGITADAVVENRTRTTIKAVSIACSESNDDFLVG